MADTASEEQETNESPSSAASSDPGGISKREMRNQKRAMQKAQKSTGNSQGIFYTLFSKVVGLFCKPEEQAFPGDTYLADMKKASKSGKPWAGQLIIAIVFCFFADLYFLHDTVDVAFDNEEGSFLSFYSWIVAATLVLLYVFIAIVFGNKFKEYKAFGVASSRRSAIISAAILFVALLLLTVFRLSSELEVSVGEIFESFFPYLSTTDYVVEISKVFVMTLMMALSAFLSSIYAYYSNDVVSQAVYQNSKSMIPYDRALYDKVFFEHSNNVESERNYETRERELDRRAVESAFKLGNIASQLNGMVDPADAYEFMQVQRDLNSDYFNEGVR